MFKPPAHEITLDTTCNPQNPLLTRQALVSYFVSFMVGSLMAQIMPTLSVYLVDKFNASAFDLGVFFIALAASSIAGSQIIGYFSDNGVCRLKIIFYTLIAGAVACLLFALSNNYWLSLATAVIFLSVSSASFPQIMAHTREYANAEFPTNNIALFNSILRASVALAWVAGPPLGFLLQHWLGYKIHYGVLGLCYAAVGLMSLYWLPSVKKETHPTKAESVKIPFNLLLGSIAMALLFSVNHSYLIALPQFIQTHLQMSTANTGYIMGLAAGLEIPIMLLGGWLAARMPLITLIRIGALSAAILYVGIWNSNALWQLFALQIFNALFVGMIAGLGITWFQDQMPKHTGFASSLFVNAINLGNILGGLIIGAFGAWLGYRNVFAVNAVVTIVALGVLFFCQQGLSAAQSAPEKAAI